MKFFIVRAVCVACLGAAAAWGAVKPEPAVGAAKRIFADKQDAVVSLSAVAKFSFTAEGSGKESAESIPDSERKMESIGTVIDSGGLVVTALSTLDPSREISGREVRMGGGTVRLEASVDLKEVKVIMPDGLEIPAEVIMKDADLDLCFIQAKTASKEAQGVAFKAVDLKRGGYHAAISDDVVSLARMDEVLSRQATVTRGQVMALTRKPREFVKISGGTLGGPTFALDGRVAGIAVNRFYRGRNSTMVVIPAEDVLEIAEQARAAKAAAGAAKAPKGQ